MRGKAHLTIGVLAGMQAALLTDTPIGMAGVVTSAIFSLLPDLDEENSTLSNWIVSRKASRRIRTMLLIIATISILLFVFTTFKEEIYQLHLPIYYVGIGIGLIVFIVLSYFITDRKVKRVLLTGVGIIIISVTLLFPLPWACYGFGGMIAILPWMKHRGITHTIWAIGFVYFFLRQIEISYNTDIAVMGTAAYASHLFIGDNLTYSGVKLLYPLPYSFKIPLISTGSLWGTLVEWTIIITFVFIVFHQLL